MLDRAQSQQCRILGDVFQRAGELGYDGRSFVDGFMASRAAEDFFSSYDRLQWLGKGYLLDEIADETSLSPSGVPAATNPEALFWTGYIYRWWGYVTGESPKAISAVANAETMFGVWEGYHTLGPDEAIARLKDDSPVLDTMPIST